MRYSPSFNFFWRALAGPAVSALLCCGPLHAQEIYRSVDADGHVVYSDRGSTKNAPSTELHVQEGNPSEAARIAREQAALKADDQQRDKQAAASAKDKAAADHRKEVACNNARNNYNHLRDANRLYHLDADGNRVYDSDTEADALRETARKSMAEACGS
jgi:Domain of unknown function (DUF4124)